MDFEEQKKEYLDALYKPDNSKKGSVDEYVKPLIDLINIHPDYYTTSSCSGRIVLFTCEDYTKKYTANWIFVSHKEVSYEEMVPFLVDLPQTDVWFRQESFIFHVCAKDFESAQKFLVFAQANGYKHTGIIGSKKRFIIEILGVERIASPIAVHGELIVDEVYLKTTLELANENLGRVHKGIDRFKKAWEEEFNK
jgi:tRNA wybutosine-synthesizing protein 3